MPVRDPKREFAVDVVRRLEAADYEAYWAGGCVRDFLLGRQAQDYDVATSARPEEVRRLFGHRRTLAVGASFGVIIVRGPKEAGDVEVATFRTEGPYLDGRRPEHVTFSSAEEDARRRDFTINGIFYDPVKQRVLDFIGGEKDLAAGIVRAIGDPWARMREDKLRLLRAVRFAATLDFRLDEDTAEAVQAMAEQLLVVSAERIAQEMRRMLIERHRKRAMQLAYELGLLTAIIPELQSVAATCGSDPDTGPWERTLRMLNLLQDPSFELAAAVLFHSIAAPGRQGGPDSTATETTGANGVEVEQAQHGAAAVRDICRRLRFSNKEGNHIAWLVGHQHDLLDAVNMRPSRLKRLIGHALFDDLLALMRASLLAVGGSMDPVLYCEKYRRQTPESEINPRPLITGDDLIAEGITQGPHFKVLLDEARDAQLDGEINSKEEALELVRRRLRDDYGRHNGE